MATMKITGLLTDDAVLAELGARIAGRRIDMQLTQAAVAEQAGIAKRTLERLEAGDSSQLNTLLRVLRVLDGEDVASSARGHIFRWRESEGDHRLEPGHE
jgi:transcriptional regulator with XRE-family HTH domain